MPSLQNNPHGRTCVCALLAILSLGLAAESSAQMMSSSKAPITPPKKTEGIAVWYSVPPNSLAKRRGGKNELTAAHNALPLGTRVRVTHLGNKKSVVVRITDRGIRKRGAVIDLCKEAATQLDMVREGSARVQLEVLPEEKAPPSKAAMPW